MSEPAPATSAFRDAHIKGFDDLRLAAALAVVAIHAGGLGDASGCGACLFASLNFAIPAFSMMAGFLTVRTLLRPGTAVAGYLGRRALRLLWPYLFWTAVFLVLRHIVFDALLAHGRATPRAADSWGFVIFLGAAGPHLWYLPSLLYATLLAGGLCALAARMHWPCALPLALLAVGGLVASATLPQEDHTLSQLLAFYPLRLLGFFALGGLAADRKPWLDAVFMRWRTTWAFGLGLVIAWAWAMLILGLVRGLILPYLFFTGGLFVLAVWFCKGERPAWVQRWAGYTMGIYLVHPAYTRLLNVLLDRCQAPVTCWRVLAVVAGAFVLSGTTTAIGERLPLLRGVFR